MTSLKVSPAELLPKLYSELHYRLVERCKTNPYGEDAARLSELEHRAWQLQWLIAQIASKDDKASRLAGQLPRLMALNEKQVLDGVFARLNDLAAETNLLTESFYIFANRLQEAAEGLRRLRFDAPGVRRVRHHLIIHPEKKLGKLTIGFSLGGAMGPVIKPGHDGSVNPDAVFHDEGLWPNAEEFVKKLLAKLPDDTDGRHRR